jgi:N4-gp56 family major capsid protein
MYAATTEIFNGEIGELHGVRFIESTMAPVGAMGEKVFYTTFVFGKDAFAVVDPEGAGMETIIKDKSEIGGPLNQFSTVGCKFSMAAAVLYPEAMVQINSGSSYEEVDEPNQNVIEIPQ